jgi:hypothetical protein
MKTTILMLCALFAFSLASAQETTTKKTKVKTETRDANQTPATNSVDKSGVVTPTDSPDQGANSRDNSRQSTYNNQPATTNANTNTTTTNTGTDLRNDNSGLINPTDAPAEGANSRDNSRQSNYNKEPAKKTTTTPNP